MHANAEARGLKTIDATCPLVTKVHVEAKKFAADGYTIVLVGHEGHEEVEGTMGEAPEHFVLVETEEDVDALDLPDPDRVAYLTQTTLSVDETDRIVRRLHERFPNITGPKSDDICYATTNRQLAVRQMAGECDLVLVIGSSNSSNSNRLVEVVRPRRGVAPDRQRGSGQGGVAEGKQVVGSAWSSAPEELVQRLIDFFRARGTEDVSEFEVVQEDVRFMLPRRSELPWRRGAPTLGWGGARSRARVGRLGRQPGATRVRIGLTWLVHCPGMHPCEGCKAGQHPR